MSRELRTAKMKKSSGGIKNHLLTKNLNRELTVLL